MRRSAGVMMFCVAAAVLAFAAACGSTTTTSSTTPELNGTSWRLSSWSASSPIPASVTITAEFKDGNISGSSGVNSYSGPYTVGPDDAFSVGTLMSTKMAGPEDAMQAETTYLQLLEAAKSCAVDGDTLTLSGAGGESLVYTRQ